MLSTLYLRHINRTPELKFCKVDLNVSYSIPHRVTLSMKTSHRFKAIILLIFLSLTLSGCGEEEPIVEEEIPEETTSNQPLFNEREDNLETSTLTLPTTNETAPAPEPVSSPSSEETNEEMPGSFIQAECEDSLSWSEATETITFSNQGYGIEFVFATDPDWREEDVPSYELMESSSTTRVRFGPLGTFDGCSLPQYYLLTILPQVSASSLVAEQREAVQKTINGFTVVEYESAGLCVRPALQLIGTRHNYEFTPTCGEKEELDVLEYLIESVHLL